MIDAEEKHWPLNGNASASSGFGPESLDDFQCRFFELREMYKELKRDFRDLEDAHSEAMTYIRWLEENPGDFPQMPYSGQFDRDPVVAKPSKPIPRIPRKFNPDL